MGEQSDYQHGRMDIQEQAATYGAFMALTKWGSLVSAVGLLFLTLWFATPAGFLGAAVASVVVAVLGVLILREKPKPAGH